MTSPHQPLDRADPAPPPSGPDFNVWQMPRLDPTRRRISGTAAGIAREVGIDPVYVRVSFVVLGLGGGWGLLLYVAAWIMMARKTLDGESYIPIQKGVSSTARLTGFAMVAMGLIILSSSFGLGFLSALVWPSALLGLAIAIALDGETMDRLRPLGDVQRQTIVPRVLVGLGCLFAGVIAALLLSLSFWQAVSGIVVAGLVLIGAAVVFAPILSRVTTDLLAERRRRIRSEERADMAAHLHDSVLQTLALIQKRSADPGVVSLARRQERELRTWLFDDKAMNPNLGFRAALEQQMADVEGMHAVPIEVVVVGDCPTSPDMFAMLLASKEAAANAARHSGATRVDVFAEVGAASIEVFVRDTGAGFDQSTIETDRAGVRDSIIGRMERHGGSAVVHSVPNTGTEVELRLPISEATDSVEGN